MQERQKILTASSLSYFKNSLWPEEPWGQGDSLRPTSGPGQNLEDEVRQPAGTAVKTGSLQPEHRILHQLGVFKFSKPPGASSEQNKLFFF